jgi:E3 ubiquitin-protein ligase UBR7
MYLELSYDMELTALLLRDDLVKFLRPFAQDGKVVNDSDVTAFFATLSEGRKKGY